MGKEDAKDAVTLPIRIQGLRLPWLLLGDIFIAIPCTRIDAPCDIG